MVAHELLARTSRASTITGASNGKTSGAVDCHLDAPFPGTPAGVAEVRRAVTAAVEECGLTEARLRDVQLAVSEAATNAVVHAYRDGREGDIRASVWARDGEVVVVIADDGLGMAPRTDSPGLGLGLPVISSVSDRMEVVSEGSGTEIHIAFRLAAAA